MTAALIVIAIVMLGSAAVAMVLRNIIHSALLLTLNWMGIAAYFLWADAQFVAFAQVIVYVGAVSMIVLFAVLLTRRSIDDEGVAVSRAALGRASAAFVTAAIVCCVLVAAVRSTDLASVYQKVPELAVKHVSLSDQVQGITVMQIGQELMGPQVAALLVVGVILTVALLGAVVIAAQDRSQASRVGSQIAMSDRSSSQVSGEPEPRLSSGVKADS